MNKKRVLTLTTLLILLLVWHIGAIILGSDLRLPSPKSTILSGKDLIMSPSFYKVIGSTLMRGGLSLIISAILALLLGLLAGLIQEVKILIEPIITIIRSTPTMSIIFILLSTIGGGGKASVAICVLVIFPLLYANVLKGVEQVDKGLLQMARLYEVPQWSLIKDIYLPSLKSYFLAGLMAAVGLNYKVMISAEVIGEVRQSIGKELYLANVTLDKPQVFAWSILLVLMVWCIDQICSKLAMRQQKGWTKGEETR